MASDDWEINEWRGKNKIGKRHGSKRGQEREREGGGGETEGVGKI